jgi:hypothetical protein
VKPVAAVALALILVASACSGDDDAKPAASEKPSSTSTTEAGPAAYDGYTSDVYADPASWLCRPDKDDVCDHDMESTSVAADGTSEIESWTEAKDAAIDCFYVYPTISTDKTDNSDMTPSEKEELFVVRQQAARLGAVCNVYAPVYRQTTLTALVARMGGKAPAEGTGRRAYDDVVDAWKHYIANDNHGRGVIIIGHSQGASLLGQLMNLEIDPRPELRDLLVSAMLIGSTQYASGYDNIAPCTSDRDLACLIAYSTFRSTKPPPANSFFGRPKDGEQAVCTNPAELGGSTELHGYFPSDGASILGAASPTKWGADVTTPFVSLPGLVTGECTVKDGFSYLELTVHGDPADPRVDDINGDITPEWGMHLIDVNVTMGDLVGVAGAEADAYVEAHG